MKPVKAVRVVLLVLALAAGGGWFGWRWYTTPVPPDVPLEGVRRDVAKEVERAMAEARRRPRSGRAWGELGRLLIANGFKEQAVPCLAHAQRFEPEEPLWPYLRGSVCLTLLETRESISSLRQALEVARNPEERAAVHFLLARALMEDAQLDEAERQLDALRASDGDSPRVRFGLGLLALGRDDRVGAREHFRTLTDHPCARKQVCFLLAGLIRDDDKLAESYHQLAAQLPSDLPWPNPFDRDIRNYQVDNRQPLNRYHELLMEGRREEAMDYLGRVVAESPDEQSCFMLGFALVEMGRFEEAEKPLRQSAEIAPRNLKAHLLLAVALYERGTNLQQKSDGKKQALELFEQAVAAADRALALQSDFAQAHLVRGRAQKALGRTKEALASLRHAVLVAPQAAEAHQALGELLAETGQLRQGLGHLQDAVRLADPKDDRPRKALQKWRAVADRQQPGVSA